jgi:uncharacterized membrane protein HdeD (DUF308 family)
VLALRSRLISVLALALIVGLMVFGTGTASAVTGLSGDGSASEAQYDPPGRTAHSLPFTGLWVVPLLIGGVALAVSGGLLRSRFRERDHS